MVINHSGKENISIDGQITPQLKCIHTKTKNKTIMHPTNVLSITKSKKNPAHSECKP